MNLRTPNAVLLLALPLLAACAATAPTTRAQAPADTTRKPATAAATAPAEDFSKYRPTFTLPAAPVAGTTAATPAPPRPAGPSAAQLKAAAPAPTSQVNTQLDQRLRDQAYMNQNVKYAQGYRIRAYLGVDREQVMGIRRQVISRYPDETDYITFKQPMYRLYIGDYLTRLDALRGLARVRQFVPKAELEPMQVLLNKVP